MESKSVYSCKYLPEEFLELSLVRLSNSLYSRWHWKSTSVGSFSHAVILESTSEAVAVLRVVKLHNSF